MPTGLFDDLVEAEEPKQSSETNGLYDDLVDRDEGTTLSGKYFPPEERKGITYEGHYYPSIYEMEKERETQVRKTLPKGAFQHFREGVTKGFVGSAAMGGYALTQSDDKLKYLLMSEQKKLQASEGEPTFTEKAADVAGNLLGAGITSVVGQMAGGGKPALAAQFGLQSAGDSFLKAGLRAMAEGKTPDEAVKIARKVAIAGAGIGAVEGVAVPVGGGSAAQVLKSAGAGGAIFGGGTAAGNIAEQQAGLKTPIFEGVMQGALFGSAFPVVLGGAGAAARALLRKGARTPAPAPPPIEPTIRPAAPIEPVPQVTQEATIPAPEGFPPLPRREPSGLSMVEPETQPQPSRGEIKATPALLEQLPPGKLAEVPVSELLKQPVERGPALAAVEELGQSIRRRTDFEKARAETVSQQHEAIVHPDKPLTDNQLGLIEDSLKRAILENQIPGERPGIIAGSKLEKWADDFLSTDPRYRVSANPVDVLVKDIAALSIKGAAVIERGIRDYPAWSAEMSKLYGEEVKPILRKVYMQSLQMKGANALQRETAQVLQPVREQPGEGQGQVPIQERVRETSPRSEQPVQPGEGTKAQVPLTELLNKPVQEIAAAYESIPPDQIASYGVENFNRALGEKASTPEDIAALKMFVRGDVLASSDKTVSGG